jgi:hypothetical protein
MTDKATSPRLPSRSRFFSCAAAPVTNTPLQRGLEFRSESPATTYDEGPAHIVSSGQSPFRTKK